MESMGGDVAEADIPSVISRISEGGYDMKWYQYAISEHVYREVWIEAETEEEARKIAMNTNIGSAKRDVCLLEVDYEDH